MNRFVIGGILAAIVVLLTGSLSRLLGDRSPEPGLVGSQPNTTETGDLGSLPVEQAGQLVRRQSDLGAGGIPTSPDTVFNDQPGATMPSGRSTLSPDTTGTFTPAPGNVIPRPGDTATYPANVGDIAPVQPGLVQPGVRPENPTDPDIDSIPALW
ncbi:hypothetical protein IQ254_10345 [Nodosilinea sp. LEGE 07088]|uniref:hypothetical protein n=1 Tax=Nodosilinea sp. LEGE 07088 TaxID=2777968 RepID=UPI00187E0C9E|nr:hypothetical protein [Nodosilinea sp. LEGE 07088]MBE9137608.1 hypothetical protein [Nodosilinea sp. LEGE 07088]